MADIHLMSNTNHTNLHMRKPNKIKRKTCKSNPSDKTEFSSILKKLSQCVFKYWFPYSFFPLFWDSKWMWAGSSHGIYSLPPLCFPSFCFSVLTIWDLGYYLSPEIYFKDQDVFRLQFIWGLVCLQFTLRPMTQPFSIPTQKNRMLPELSLLTGPWLQHFPLGTMKLYKALLSPLETAPPPITWKPLTPLLPQVGS